MTTDRTLGWYQGWNIRTGRFAVPFVRLPDGRVVACWREWDVEMGRFVGHSDFYYCADPDGTVRAVTVAEWEAYERARKEAQR
ncbi:MAG: hypothetical protein RMK01_04050 [Thermomicrobium sp.]|nr:hypothetical protein [Thermomicrobium sp.]